MIGRSTRACIARQVLDVRGYPSSRAPLRFDVPHFDAHTLRWGLVCVDEREGFRVLSVPAPLRLRLFTVRGGRIIAAVTIAFHAGDRFALRINADDLDYDGYVAL